VNIRQIMAGYSASMAGALNDVDRYEYVRLAAKQISLVTDDGIDTIGNVSNLAMDGYALDVDRVQAALVHGILDAREELQRNALPRSRASYGGRA
jgi:hypothetical protein